jgi:hypothetical protein
MRARLVPVSLLALTLACSGTACGGATGADGSSIPSALRERSEREEIVRFTGFTVPGLVLYRASGSVPDHGWSYIVGVDADGRAVEGAALMRRLGEMTPQIAAERAIAIILREAGDMPLSPSDQRPQFATEQEWTIVQAPRREGNAIVFFVMSGEMNPTLVEVSIALDTFTASYRSAVDVLLAAGQTVIFRQAFCQPFAWCGCYDGCRRFVGLRVPPTGDVRFRLESEPEGDLYQEGPACTGQAACAQVCRADAPTANCDPILVRVGEACNESCVPTEAPYRCETLEDSCRVVPHTVRVPSR